MESNKLIAEFMDMELEHDKVWLNEIFHKDLIRGRDYYEYANTKNVEYDGLSWNSVLVEIEYHSSWDWLMPVVETCYHNGADSNQVGDITHALLDCNLEATFDAVVEFIKWYNQKQYESEA